jgi:hypothetical protein
LGSRRGCLLGQYCGVREMRGSGEGRLRTTAGAGSLHSDKCTYARARTAPVNEALPVSPCPLVPSMLTRPCAPTAVLIDEMQLAAAVLLHSQQLNDGGVQAAPLGV